MHDRMPVKQIKSKLPVITIVLSVIVILMGFSLLIMPEDFVKHIIMLAEVSLLFIYGGYRAIYSIAVKKPQTGAATLVITWGIGLVLVYAGYSGDAAVVLPSITVGAVSVLLGLMRLLICINCFINRIKGAVRNGISAFLCIAFGLIMVIRPIYNFSLLAVVAAFYLIFYGITMLLDGIAAISRSDMNEKKLKRRVHFAAPNVITAVKPSRMIADINKKRAEGKLESGMIIEQKADSGFDKANLEVMVHLTTQGANKFGHVDICIGDTIYSYGTYDSSTVKLGGFVSQGTVIIVPKMPYLRYCLDVQQKYVIGFGAHLSQEQLSTVIKRIEYALSLSEPLESEYEKAVKEGKDGSKLDDTASKIARVCHGKVYTVKSGMFRRYFGINTNCVRFADWLLNDTGIDAISFSGFRTPGAYYAMLDNMFKRENTRVFRKTSYILSDEIKNIDADEITGLD